MNTVFVSLIRLVALGSLLLWVTGCAVINSHQKTLHEGTQVTVATFDQLRPGVTTEAWIRATLGHPSDTREVDKGVRILRYTSKEITRYETELLFVLNTSSRKEAVSTVFFEIRDGVLDRYWTESERNERRS